MVLVVDTSVFVTALRNSAGASAEIIRGVRRGRFRMCASVPLFLEYEAVACRTEHLEAAGLTAGDVALVLGTLARFLEPVEIRFLWRPMLRDPGDDMVLETAVNGGAKTIVSFNRRDFLPECRLFGVEVMTPSEFLGAK